MIDRTGNKMEKRQNPEIIHNTISNFLIITYKNERRERRKKKNKTVQCAMQ